MRLIIDRRFEGWHREYYEVDRIDDETIQKALDYDIEPDGDELLYGSFEDTGDYEVLDE